jgi:integrase
LRIAVPRPIRPLFLSGTGKPREFIVEPLGRNYDPARVECDRRVADYRALFARASLMTPDAVQAEIEAIKQRATERRTLADLPLLESELERHRRDSRDQMGAAYYPGGVSESSMAQWRAHLEFRRRLVRESVANIVKHSNPPILEGSPNRGRFQGDNPFEDQRRKAGGEKREAFTAAELHKIFASLPLDIAPAKHSPESALPWAVRIAAYTGMRLEEISQLTVADIQTRGSNGGTVIVFDIHNGDNAHHLKNDSSARAIPLHSELARAGLLDYIRALPQDGLLFPGLKRRASKGGKIGARLGELFRKKLVKLGMKRDGLCFHSFRHTVAQRLEAAAVSQTDAARVTGHTIEGMTYGVYSTGPGLKRLAAVVEAVRYDE